MTKDRLLAIVTLYAEAIRPPGKMLHKDMTEGDLAILREEYEKHCSKMLVLLQKAVEDECAPSI